MMRSVRLIIASFLLASSLSFAFVGTAKAFELFGDPCTVPTSKDATVCKDAKNQQTTANNSIYGPNGVVRKIVKILSLIIGFAAVVMIIVGGMQYMLSNGDSNKIAGAKNTIIYALVGLLVAGLAQTLVIFVINRLS